MAVNTGMSKVLEKRKIQAALSVLKEIEQSMKSSPSRELIQIKSQLLNDRIDQEASKSFSVKNSAHMASCI